MTFSIEWFLFAHIELATHAEQCGGIFGAMDCFHSQFYWRHLTLANNVYNLCGDYCMYINCWNIVVNNIKICVFGFDWGGIRLCASIMFKTIFKWQSSYFKNKNAGRKMHILHF